VATLGSLGLLLGVGYLLLAKVSLAFFLPVNLFQVILLIDFLDCFHFRCPCSRLFDLLQDAFLLIFQHIDPVFDLDFVAFERLEAFLGADFLLLVFRGVMTERVPTQCVRLMVDRPCLPWVKTAIVGCGVRLVTVHGST